MRKKNPHLFLQFVASVRHDNGTPVTSGVGHGTLPVKSLQ